MSLFIKITAAIIGLLIVIVGGAAIYLFTIFDANDYKAEIQALVKKHSQLELTIDGQLQLSVFPWLGVSVENVAVDSPEGRLASAGYARIFAKFMPLLKGNIEVDGIALRDFKLQLVKDAKGRGNWQLNTPTKPDAKTSSPQPADISLAAFALGYLEIENAEINYRDLSTGSFQQLQKLSLRVNNVSSTSEFPITADFRYLNNDLSAPIQAHLTSQVAINIDKQQLSLIDTVLDVGDMRIRTNVEVQQLLKAPFIDGRLAITEFKPAEWASILQIPALADLALDMEIKTDFQLDTGKGQLALQNLAVNGSGVKLTGALNAKGLNESPSYLGNIAISQLNPGTLLPAVGVELPKPASSNVLKSLTGGFDLAGTDNSLQLSKINLKLDDSSLQGEAGISSFKNMASRFALTIDSINLDHYIPAPQAAQSKEKTNTPNTSSEALLLPVAALRELNTNGRLRIGKLIASGHQIDNFDASVVSANGFINLKNLTGNLYGGSLVATASIDARSNTPQISFNNRVSNIQASPLLTALADVDYLDGKMNLQVNGTAFGNTLTAIKNTLSGEADFKVTDGILKNTNIEQLVCKSIARIRDRQYVVTEQQPDTLFKEFNGHMNIVKGVMNTDRLLVALNNMQVTGTGIINLPQDSLDFGIRAKIMGDLENQACEVHERYRDIAWPLRCKGSFSDEPSKLCGLDQRELENIAAQLAKKEVQNKVSEKLDEKLKDKLGGETTKQLKDLFGL